jgi:2-haloacid dehalogenase
MSYVSASTGLPTKAVLFDTFGTVVDWRSGVARDVAAFAKRHRLVDLDASGFADAWRAKYEPSMEPIRDGSRDFVPLDQLHRETLISTLAEFGLEPADYGDELSDLTAAWERLDPWEDSIAGLAELRRHVIVGPLSNANLALLLRMALRADLPWTVIIGSDVTRAYKPSPQAYRNAAFLLRLAPGEVMLAAAHNGDLAAAQRAGLATAFIPRPTELGPGQTKDLAPEGDWDLVCHSIVDLGVRFGGL